MKNLKSKIIIVLLFIIFSAFMIIYALKIDASTPTLDIYPNNTYKETLKVVSDENYPPFSYKNKKGEMVGSDIEHMNSIANEMGVNIEYSFHSWPKAIEAMENNEADIILGLEYKKDYYDKFELTLPVEINQYVSFGLKDYSSVQELISKKIAVLEYSSVLEKIVIPMGIRDVTVFIDYEDAFAAINNNEIDYLIARNSVGNYLLDRNDFGDIETKGHTLYSNAFCFGLQKNNKSLLENINKAIESNNYSGISYKISEKWLGDYNNSTTLVKYIKYNLTTISVVSILIAIAILTCIIIRFRFHKRKAQKDTATGILNKSYTEKYIESELYKKSTGALFIIDIDKFKNINDKFGHAIGDECILSVAKALESTFRNRDIIGRIGGDEFMVFMKNTTNKELALRKANILKSSLKSWSARKSMGFSLEISVGIAFTEPNINFKTLYESADKKLYEEKKGKL